MPSLYRAFQLAVFKRIFDGKKSWRLGHVQIPFFFTTTRLDLCDVPRCRMAEEVAMIAREA